MSNLLASVLGAPPTYPTLGESSDNEAPSDAAQSFPTGTTVDPKYDNTSSVDAPPSTAYAAGALGPSGAENLKGGAVGADYSATTLQGAHFPTSSTTDDHPGGGDGRSQTSYAGGDSSSAAFAAPALGDAPVDNLRGGTVGGDYSATTLQGANFPTSVVGDSHPGSGGAGLTASGKDFDSNDVHAQAEQVAERADADFAPTSQDLPSGTDQPEAKRQAGAVGDVHEKSEEKPSVKDKLKTGLNKVLHPKSSSSSGDHAPSEPSYKELYDRSVTSKVGEDVVREHHLTHAEVAESANSLRRDEGPGHPKCDVNASS